MTPQFLALLKPALFALKNRVRSNYRLTRRMGRDAIIVLLSIVTIAAVYRGTMATVSTMNEYASLTWLPPAFPLALMFLMIFVMLIITNAISSLSAFYRSRDLELILAAPVSPGHLFAARFLTVCASSSWMVFVFAFPAVAGFGQAYGSGWLYYLAAALLLIPYFILASSTSIVLTTLCACLAPARRTHSFMLLATVVVLGLFLYLLTSLLPASSAGNAEQILYFLSVVSATNSLWAPSVWLATPLGEILQSSGRSIAPYIVLLCSGSLAAFCLAYCSVRLLYRRAYSRTHSSGSSLQRNSRRVQKFFLAVLPLLRPQLRALLIKELKVNSRDLVQVLQFLMLIGLCLIYLYNFRMLQSINALPSPSRYWWRGILVLMNSSMAGFVLTALCSRFVFPSLSLEGQSFWLLQSAPLSISAILKGRFWFWYIPTSLLGIGIMISGSSAIDPSAEIVVLNIFFSAAMCAGMVGLAVGTGALFAEFEWEHASQLAASFGSLVFMMSSFVLIMTSMLPAGTVIFLHTAKSLGYGISQGQWYLCVGLSVFLISYLNFLVCGWAISLGQNALIRRQMAAGTGC